MTGCAVLAFVPPAYFAGISTTRHMVGMNFATALAVTLSVGVLISLVRGRLARAPRRPGPRSDPAVAEPQLTTAGTSPRAT
jgi:hypothetical protein